MRAITGAVPLGKGVLENNSKIPIKAFELPIASKRGLWLPL
jgi:hypothetical protein